MKSQRLSFGAPVSRCEGDEAPERQPVFDRRQDVLFRWTDAIPYPGSSWPKKVGNTTVRPTTTTVAIQQPLNIIDLFFSL